MKKLFIRLTCLVVFPITTLVACTGQYHFNSNLKSEVFTEYFSASEVKIYTHENKLKIPNKYIGVVEGDDCQTKEHLAPPDKVNARTSARKTAYKLKANAIIFTTCVEIDSKQCIAQVVCYGKAYQVDKQVN